MPAHPAQPLEERSNQPPRPTVSHPDRPQAHPGRPENLPWAHPRGHGRNFRTAGHPPPPVPHGRQAGVRAVLVPRPIQQQGPLGDGQPPAQACQPNPRVQLVLPDRGNIRQGARAIQWLRPMRASSRQRSRLPTDAHAHPLLPLLRGQPLGSTLGGQPRPDAQVLLVVLPGGCQGVHLVGPAGQPPGERSDELLALDLLLHAITPQRKSPRAPRPALGGALGEDSPPQPGRPGGTCQSSSSGQRTRTSYLWKSSGGPGVQIARA